MIALSSDNNLLWSMDVYTSKKGKAKSTEREKEKRFSRDGYEGK